MTPFAYLLVAHLIGDFLFQTSWMAANKAKKWGALFAHVFVYTIIVALIAWVGYGGLSIWGIMIIFLSHLVLDRRTFVDWWVRTVMKPPESQKSWLMIVADQIFHIIFLVIALEL